MQDETFGLGGGRYSQHHRCDTHDAHGSCKAVDIFKAHLVRVLDMCAEAELKPMMYSDMFFHFAQQPNRASSEGIQYSPALTVVKPYLTARTSLIGGNAYNSRSEYSLSGMAEALLSTNVELVYWVRRVCIQRQPLLV